MSLSRQDCKNALTGSVKFIGNGIVDVGLAIWYNACCALEKFEIKGLSAVIISTVKHPRLQTSARCQSRGDEASLRITSGADQRGVPGPIAADAREVCWALDERSKQDGKLFIDGVRSDRMFAARML